jgi:hypothetical protein
MADESTQTTETSTATTSEAGGGGAATETGSWGALSDDLKPVAEKYKTPAEAAKAYRELEGKLGSAIFMPKDDDAEGQAKFYERLGRPRDAAGYTLPALPEGATIDGDMFASTAKLAHKHGMPKKQFEGFFRDIVTERHTKATAAQAEMTAKRNEAMAEVHAEFGGAKETKTELARRAARVLGVDKMFNTTADEVVKNPFLLRQLAAIAETMGEDRIEGLDRKPLDVSPDQAKEKIAAIRGDSKHPFNNERDPKHSAAVAEMSRLYEAAHPEQKAA